MLLVAAFWVSVFKESPKSRQGGAAVPSVPPQRAIGESLRVLGRTEGSVCHSWSLEGTEGNGSPAEAWLSRLAGVCSK